MVSCERAKWGNSGDHVWNHKDTCITTWVCSVSCYHPGHSDHHCFPGSWPTAGVGYTPGKRSKHPSSQKTCSARSRLESGQRKFSALHFLTPQEWEPLRLAFAIKTKQLACPANVVESYEACKDLPYKWCARHNGLPKSVVVAVEDSRLVWHGPIKTQCEYQRQETERTQLAWTTWLCEPISRFGLSYGRE